MSVRLGNVYFSFGIRWFSLEEAAKIRLEGMHVAISKGAQTRIFLAFISLEPKDIGLNTGGEANFAEGFCHYISA